MIKYEHCNFPLNVQLITHLNYFHLYYVVKKNRKLTLGTRSPSHTCLEILNSKSRSFTALTPAIVLMKSI